MIITVDPHQYLYFNVWLEFLVALMFYSCLFWAGEKKNINSCQLSHFCQLCLFIAHPNHFFFPATLCLACFPTFMVWKNCFLKRLSEFILLFSIWVLFFWPPFLPRLLGGVRNDKIKTNHYPLQNLWLVISFFKNLKSALLIQSPKIKAKAQVKIKILAFKFYYDSFCCFSHL